ncbi:MAG: xpsF [Chlamydiia bacterium]|nr:xpsF [Chlamydiia bacterium]
MALYAYKAYTAEGKKTQGTLESTSEQEAKQKIRELHLILCELKESKDRKGFADLSKDNLIVFTSQLSQLISAKIPLYESLLALEEQARSEPYHSLVLSLSERVKAGSSLSKTMQDFPNSFSPLYRALISAGEAVGNLELSLVRLSSLLSYQRKMAKQLMSALTYPLFLAAMMFVSICILIGFVIPSIEALFEGRTLPWFTAIVFATSSIARDYWYFFVGGGIAIPTFLYFELRKPSVKAKLQRFSLKIPVLNRYIIHASLARFARTLATLLDGGLPLPQSLAYASEALHNARLQEIVDTAAAKVIEGKTISHELLRYKEIPSLFSRMIRIGEESGKLSPMLTQVASIYEEETERTLNKLVTLAQPILLIVMGGVIGTVVISILLPLSDFGSAMDM